MATLLLNRGRINLVKITLSPFIFIKFILYGKKNTKYEISVSKLTHPPNFILILLKIENVAKVGLWPQNKEWRNYINPVMTSSILLWFWIEFVTYFHTTKFCFNWPSNNGNKVGGRILPPYLVDFPDPIPFMVKSFIITCFILNGPTLVIF